MPYGTLNPAQRKAVRKAVKGLVVHDLGAGDLALSRELLRLGASKVIAVDKNDMPDPPPGIQTVKVRFEGLDALQGDFAVPDVAFVSWPLNRVDVGLLNLCIRARRIIYLGCNTGGTACGFPELFGLFRLREVLAYAPDRQNTLAVYEGTRDTFREPLGEELAGMQINDEMLRYEDVER